MLSDKQQEMRLRHAPKLFGHDLRKKKERTQRWLMKAGKLPYTSTNVAFYRAQRALEAGWTFETRASFTIPCDICNEPKAEKNLRTDHDHQTNHIRGLLCHQCNNGLGQFKDSTFNLATAKRYLHSRRYGSPHIPLTV